MLIFIKDLLTKPCKILDKKYAWGYNSRGYCYGELFEYERGIKDFDEALKIDPKIADFHFNRGLCHNMLKKYEKAINDFDKAIKFNQNFVDPYVQKGNSYKALGRYEESLAEYRKAANINDPRKKEILKKITDLKKIKKFNLFQFFRKNSFK